MPRASTSSSWTIIGSLEADGRKVFSVNLPNRGAVAGLPSDAVLELPALATARGFLPVAIPDFPPALCALLSKHIAIAELTVEAALHGDRRLFVEALLLSSCLPDPSRAGALADEMLAVSRALPASVRVGKGRRGRGGGQARIARGRLSPRRG